MFQSLKHHQILTYFHFCGFFKPQVGFTHILVNLYEDFNHFYYGPRTLLSSLILNPDISNRGIYQDMTPDVRQEISSVNIPVCIFTWKQNMKNKNLCQHTKDSHCTHMQRIMSKTLDGVQGKEPPRKLEVGVNKKTILASV